MSLPKAWIPLYSHCQVRIQLLTPKASVRAEAFGLPQAKTAEWALAWNYSNVIRSQPHCRFPRARSLLFSPGVLEAAR